METDTEVPVSICANCEALWGHKCAPFSQIPLYLHRGQMATAIPWRAKSWGQLYVHVHMSTWVNSQQWGKLERGRVGVHGKRRGNPPVFMCSRPRAHLKITEGKGGGHQPALRHEPLWRRRVWRGGENTAFQLRQYRHMERCPPWGERGTHI